MTLRRPAAPLLVLGLVLGTLTAPSATPARAQEATGLPAWLTYARDAAFEAVVQQGIEVPTRDGSHLSCDLYLPGTGGTAGEGPFPGVLYQYHGYGTNRGNSDPPKATFLAERGYAVLQCNVRGTGGSPGTIDIVSPQEARDGYDAVEWLAAQPFSTGRIGMIGYSYGALTTNAVAAQRPPHLMTIVPQSAWEDPYRDIVYLGGSRTLDVRGWLRALLLGLNTLITPPDQQAALIPRTDELDAEHGAHPLFDDYWRDRGVDHAAIAASGIPILAIGGWFDLYQRGTPANYQQLRDQTWLLMEPAAHLDSDYFGTTDRGVLAWLDHWLLQLPDAPLPSARVTSFEMPVATGRWTELADWPAPTATPARLHLRSDGGLAAEPDEAGSTTYVVDAADGLPSYWNVGHRPDSEDLIAWQTAREAERFAQATEPLADDVVLAGTPTASIPASFSADDGVLVVRLSDVAPDGSTTLITTGWLRASHRIGHLRAVPPVPGETATYDVELWPTHWRFAAGHRIQVSISSGDVPRQHPDAPPGTVTVITGEGGATLDLPLVGGAAERIAGPTRVETGVAAATRGWPSARRALLARSDAHPDALAAASAAAVHRAPLLLTSGAALDPAVGDELERLGVDEVVLLGGAAALGPQVEADLDARGLAHRRVGGADRYATAALLADEVAGAVADEGGAVPQVVLAAGEGRDGRDGWPDALSAGRLAAAGRAPLLLTAPDRLPAATRDALQRLLRPGGEVVVVGGPAAVDQAVVDELAAAGWAVRRIAGDDRYATAAAVLVEAEALGADPQPVLLASGRRFADALTASVLAHQLDGALLLVDPEDLAASPVTADVLRSVAGRDGPRPHVLLVGGSAAIGDRVAAQVAELVGEHGSHRAAAEPAGARPAIRGRAWPLSHDM